MNWEYYHLNEDGKLVDEGGYKAFAEDITFSDYLAAEKWLESMDYRGSVRPSKTSR